MKKNLIVSSILTFGLITGCGESADSGDSGLQLDTDVMTESVEKTITKSQQVYYMLPSPIEVALVLQRAGARYNSELPNKVESASSYETTKSMALNLGIYGADLSYASIFGQTQESMFILKACKGLADKLGVSNAFNENIIARMEDNIDDRDSMLIVISDSYWLADAYLKEYERSKLASLILAGGWIEGLYFATQLVDTPTPNPDLVDRVMDQGYSLSNVIDLISGIQDLELDELVRNLKELDVIYKGIERIDASSETTTSANGVTTIGGSTTMEITPVQLTDLIKKVESIRNSFI